MGDDTTSANLPGAGAEQLASRASRRAARLREDQAMGLGADAAVEEQLRQAERRLRSYSQGAEGERLVAQALGFVERYGWVALHDVHWPGRPKANIDHIAVGPGGIVVVDAKNWTGEVAVTSGVLRQNGYSRERETTSAATATAAVTSRLASMHRGCVHAVLCLVAQDVPPVVVGQTTVVGRSSLAEHLVSLPVLLTAYEVADVARFLATDLGGARSPDVLTTADVTTEALARAGFTVSAQAPQSSRPARQAGRARPSRTGVRPVPSGREPRQTSGGRPTGRRPVGRRRGRAVVGVLARLAVLVALVMAAPHVVPWVAGQAGEHLTSIITPEVPSPAPDPVAPTP